MTVKCDERLNAVLAELEVGDRVADIGCDHGKIAVSAVEITKNGVIAADISAQSLMKAKRLAEASGLENKMTFVECDGLKPLARFDIDTVIIAGLGGLETVKILSEAEKRYRKYVLVPHQHASAVRDYLSGNGYGVYKDYIVECGKKFYPVIVASGSPSESVEYSQFGRLFGIEANAAQKKYITHRQKVLKALSGKARGERKAEILGELEIIEESLKR